MPPTNALVRFLQAFEFAMMNTSAGLVFNYDEDCIYLHLVPHGQVILFMPHITYRVIRGCGCTLFSDLSASWCSEQHMLYGFGNE